MCTLDFTERRVRDCGPARLPHSTLAPATVEWEGRRGAFPPCCTAHA